MNILVVDDRGSTSFYLAEALDRDGHRVLEAANINDAKTHWDKRKTTPIDCIIVDLNMPSDGLTREQKGESHRALLTGWLWLRDCVLPDVPIGYRQRVIICSEYVRDFRELVPAHEYLGISLVDKHAPSGSAAKVLEHVHVISLLAE